MNRNLDVLFIPNQTHVRVRITSRSFTSYMWCLFFAFQTPNSIVVMTMIGFSVGLTGIIGKEHTYFKRGEIHPEILDMTKFFASQATIQCIIIKTLLFFCARDVV